LIGSSARSDRRSCDSPRRRHHGSPD
jgi:hypothetical protein